MFGASTSIPRFETALSVPATQTASAFSSTQSLTSVPKLLADPTLVADLEEAFRSEAATRDARLPTVTVISSSVSEAISIVWCLRRLFVFLDPPESSALTSIVKPPRRAVKQRVAEKQVFAETQSVAV